MGSVFAKVHTSRAIVARERYSVPGVPFEVDVEWADEIGSVPDAILEIRDVGASWRGGRV